MRRLILTGSLGMVCALAFSAAGCRLVLVQPSVAVAPGYGGEIIVQQAPPPLLVEPQPVCPGPGYAFCPGYWHWQHGRHVWVNGRWAVPPRRAAVWVPPHWEHHGHDWRFVPGHWR
jgi:hypothetical protein